MRDKKVQSSSADSNLTKKQVEVLDMLKKEFLTVKDIAQRRGTGLKSVYNIINILIRKGLISRGYTRGLKKRKKVQNIDRTRGRWRLHAQHFNLSILHRGSGYDGLRSKKNLIFLDGNTVKLHRDVVEVYAGESLWFWGLSPGDAEDESFKYWMGFFAKLEQRVGCILVKDGVSSVNQNKAHLAHVEDEVAKEYVKRRQPLKVYAHEDGKLAMMVDQSHGEVELEFLHPQAYKMDADRVVGFLEGLRGYEDYTPGFVVKSFGALTVITERNTAHIQEILEIIKEILERGS